MASPDSLPPIIAMDAHVTADSTSPAPPVSVPVKDPEGLFRFNYTIDSQHVEHTIQFNQDKSFRLEEKYYPGEKVVVTNGHWSPSDGYIWIYNQQVLRGRYKWNGDTLQYYSPSRNQAFSMMQSPSILSNKVWQEKRKQNIKFFGIGNEPFWSVEVSKDNKIFFQLSEWNAPKTFTVTNSGNSEGNLVFNGTGDTSMISLTIYSQFCSDGMSDFVYPRKVNIQLGTTSFSGCGMLYAQ